MFRVNPRNSTAPLPQAIAASLSSLHTGIVLASRGQLGGSSLFELTLAAEAGNLGINNGV